MPKLPLCKCPTLAALLALGAGWLTTPVLANVAPAYEVTDLGAGFFPTGVNSSGWVSGYTGRAVLWRPGVGTVDLGMFGSTTGGVANRAIALNDAGQVVGYTYSVPAVAYRAFRWTEAEGLIDLGDLPDGGSTSYATAINNAGVAAGRGSGQFNGHPSYGFLSFNHAVRFDAPGTLLHLEAHAEATLNSIVRGINDDGVTVGERQTADGWRAILWSDDGTPLNLGAVWGLGGSGAASHSFARDINNLGQVALQLPLGAGSFTAALWQEGAGFTTLGLLDGFSTDAQAINDAGLLVGVAGAPGVAGSQAYAWSEADGLVVLSTRIDAASSAGWAILDATGVSENGLIVGRGWHPTLGYRGVLLTPVPELPSLLLAAMGVVALLGWTRRSAAA